MINNIPVDEERIENLRKLCEHLEIPVTGAEFTITRTTLRDLAKQRDQPGRNRASRADRGFTITRTTLRDLHKTREQPTSGPQRPLGDSVPLRYR